MRFIVSYISNNENKTTTMNANENKNATRSKISIFTTMISVDAIVKADDNEKSK